MDENDKVMEKEFEKKVEKKVEKWVTAAVTVVVNIVVSFAVTIVIVKLVWGWVIPDIFPGAVDEGLVSGDLTWLDSAKLAILVAVLSGINQTIQEAFNLKK